MHQGPEFAAVADAMATIDFCMMQTVGPHGINTRPMSNNGEVRYDGDTWFFARTSSHKVAEITKDARVHLTFADTEGPSFIAVWGTGVVHHDVSLKQKLWQESLAQWFEHGPEHKDVCLIQVTADRIQTWGRLGDYELS